MMRQWWLGVLCVLALASVLLAKQGVIVTKDGRSIQGDIDDTPGTEAVAITIHGVKTTILRNNVASIVYSNNVDQEFSDRLSKLAPNDVPGRVNLARWAFDNHKYELAKQADESALKIDPINADARSMMDTIQSAITAETTPAITTGGVGVVGGFAAPAQNTQPPQESPAPAAAVGNYLTPEDINKIRQAEFTSDDVKTIRVTFANKVRDRFLAVSDKDPTAYLALSEGEQAKAILDTGDANLMKDVKIVTDPAALLEYRAKIQPRILTGCAASGCHGGANGGSFYLYPNADQTAVWYTNFYILQKYTSNVAGAGGLQTGQVLRAMIDRTHPRTSLLVQFGLPLNIAATPHPKVDGLKPAFVSEVDPTYIQIIKWMSSSLKPFADYDIKYDLPTGKSSTQPSTRPAE